MRANRIRAVTRDRPLLRPRAVAAVAIVAVAGTAGVMASTAEPMGSPGAVGVADTRGAPKQYNPAEPEEWMFAQRMNPDGTIPERAYQDAVAASQRLEQQTTRAQDTFAGARWRLVGPANIGARVIDMAVDPRTPDTVYVAAGSGGVWKTTDGGRTFAPAWPSQYVQSMGALAITPDGVLYAGTGEPDHGGGGSYYGTGVYRSADGGRTWTNLGLADTGGIGRIAVDPVDPRRVFVAAQGRNFDGTGSRGLFLTTDGGATWRQVLAGPNDATGAIDVAINPARPNEVLAALWQKRRFPDGREYGGPGSGLYRSTDGGATWTRVGAPLPDPATEPGRIGVAYAKSDPDRVYAITNDKIGYPTGFFTSADGGATWTPVPQTDSTLRTVSGGFAWWFGRLWVDPADADHVFVAGVRLTESTDGGRTWTRSQTVHTDQHTMAWDPHRPGRVYLGNDGGFYWSDANGDADGVWGKSSYQPFMQFYAMDVSEQDVKRLVAGTQDNGSLRSWGGSGDWNEHWGGDGMTNRIDPTDNRYVYACYQNAGCARSEDGAETMQPMTFPGERFNWVAPLEYSPADPATLYLGGNVLDRSTDRGRTWTRISPDLTGGPTPRGRGYGTITAIGLSRTDPDLVYVGTDDGRLWRTTDGGANWTRLTDPDLPERWVTRVTVDPDDARRAWVSYSGFRWESETQPHVLMTTDGGDTWVDVSGNLPQAPVNDVIRDPSHPGWLYVATDVGVFGTRDLGRSWFKLGRELPMVPVNDIRFHAGTRTLFAATYGRGIWSARVPD